MLLVSMVSTGRGRVLVHKVQESVKVSGTFVLLCWAILREPVQGWVSLYLYITSVVFSCVKIGNHQVVDSGKVLCKLNPYGSKFLAVSTPWGIVLHKDILGGVGGNSLVGRSNNSVDSFLFSWDWLRLDMRSDFASFERGNQVFVVLDLERFDITWGVVFLHVLGWAQEDNLWGIFFDNSEEFSDFLVKSISDTGNNELNVSFELLGSLGDLSNDMRLFVLLREQKHRDFLASKHVFDFVWAESN